MMTTPLWVLGAACVALLIYCGCQTLIVRRRDRYDRPRRWFDLR